MATTENYRAGRHRVFGTHVHLIFVTKYRRNVLTGQHHDFLHEVFSKVCTDFGASLSECNGEDDHVHPLVEYPPQIAVSKLVNSLQSVTSRRLKQHFPTRTYRGHVWSPSYFAASCDGAPLSITRQYVENQRRPA
ncbi:putative transposase [Actinopolyspora lacussalsi subsp. righensis]|uniref:Putative transposase n=1 Tax=Actinopolyspora righensis TaxID=995060 RepID=A0A1I7B552_9ACTN|nr:IS200/IS605 family transposase [Actinopolyspora righensis]SFT82255.1 putative transposase [Actinopolyspora righensis]